MAQPPNKKLFCSSVLTKMALFVEVSHFFRKKTKQMQSVIHLVQKSHDKEKKLLSFKTTNVVQ